MSGALKLEIYIAFVLISLISNLESKLVQPQDVYNPNIDLHNILCPRLRDYEVVIPEFLDEAGNKLYLRHHAEKTSRDLKYIRIPTSDWDFLIHLRKSNHIIDATRFAVKLYKNGTEVRAAGVDVSEIDGTCLYEGVINSDSDKTAAISVCNGLRALLRADDDYFVEPVEVGVRSSQVTYVFYRRSDIMHPNSSNCGSNTKRNVEVNSNPTWRDRLHMLSGQTRQKRDIAPSNNRIIETLVVVDSAMIKKHKSQHRTDVVSYVLTVMNMVNTLFHDATLDTHLDISIIGLVLLEDDEEFNIGHNATSSLTNFCKWQLKRSSNLSKRPDHSILLTGKDICIDKDGPCDTMGLAKTNGMCIFDESCSISEDTGLGLGFTIAHEIGHSLGIAHDGEGNSCTRRGGYVMSPTINSYNGVFSWSSCSRKSLKDFLKTNQSRCLSNLAINRTDFEDRWADELPGQIYNAAKQCVLQFDVNYTVCQYMYKGNKSYICKMLWCAAPDGACKTKHLPSSEGSECGDGMWCRRGECVTFGSSGPQPTDGAWSAFSPWTKCSKTCGVGVREKRRTCDNPSPRHGGRRCEGEDVRYELCNTMECPSPHMDFRAEQCAEFDKKPYRYKYFKWIPATQRFWKSAAGPCELMCEAEGFGYSVVLAPRVIDGTRCGELDNNVCIAGKCERVGCDFRLHSNATEDRCGVCNGDNSTCRFVNGSFTEDVHESEYYTVTNIPKGASNVFVREEYNRGRLGAYIAAKLSTTDRYFLNGNWNLDRSDEISIAGTLWNYRRIYFEVETLFAKGPTRENITIEALVLHKNPGISYSYYISEPPLKQASVSTKASTTSKVEYSWHQYLTPCSKSCAGGLQRTALFCQTEYGIDADKTRCLTKPKPEPRSLSCNTHPCQAQWLVGNWSECDVTCGRGFKQRSVSCAQERVGGFTALADTRCAGEPRPVRKEACNQSVCTYWKSGRWSQCSTSCGKGYRTRDVFCTQGNISISDAECKDTKPRSRKGCRVAKCPKIYQWLIPTWSECSVTCGSGVQRRRIRCGRKLRTGSYKAVKKKRCRHVTKPELKKRRKCTRSACKVLSLQLAAGNSTKSEWIASNWSKCSATCGIGKMTRTVRCAGSERRECSDENKPAVIRECETRPCQGECNDLFEWCELVVVHKACYHSYFGSKCCKSCYHTPETTEE